MQRSEREREVARDKRGYSIFKWLDRRKSKHEERRPIIEHQVDPQTGRRTRKQSRFQTIIGSLLPDTRPKNIRQRVQSNRPKSWIQTQFAAWWQSGKWYSLSTLGIVVALFAWLSSGDRWFVYAEDVHFHGLTYLESKELYESASLSGLSTFWLAPETIRANILAHPYVVDSIVNVQVPTRVDIQVQEIRPIALWIGAEQEIFWLLEDGTALEARGAIDGDLMQIIDLKLDAKDVKRLNQQAIDLDVLNSALALARHLPKLPNLRYNKHHGLHFHLSDDRTMGDERTADNQIVVETRLGVIWGDGYNFEIKLRNLEAARKLIAEGRVRPNTVDLRPLSRPYFR